MAHSDDEDFSPPSLELDESSPTLSIISEDKDFTPPLLQFEMAALSNHLSGHSDDDDFPPEFDSQQQCKGLRDLKHQLGTNWPHGNQSFQRWIMTSQKVSSCALSPIYIFT